MRKLRIKVCGMRDPDNIRAIAALQPDYMGFIYYRSSPRYIGEKPDKDLFSALPAGISRVGVFVDETFENVVSLCKRDGLVTAQLHGNEPPELCRVIRDAGIEVIKAFNVDNDFDFSITKPYEDSCNYFLFDTKTDTPGGSGRKFSWEKLNDYNEKKLFFLSGGIGIDDTKLISEIESDRIHAVDINSRFEKAPAVKDVTLVSAFIKNIKGVL